jgi:hypothetical protein
LQQKTDSDTIYAKGKCYLWEKDKLIGRLLSRPKDFTFDEMVSLLSYFGYDLREDGLL